MKVGIVAKVGFPLAVQVAKKIIKLLAGEDILVEKKLAEKLGRQGSSPASMAKSDAVVAVGGDGTVLLAQRLASGAPVLGVHVAGRGFMAEVDLKDLNKAMKSLRSKQLSVVEKQMLAAAIGKRSLPDALNDVVVCRADIGRTVEFKVEVDEKTVMKFKGDALIVATPTGSTAYARAAGGPVVDPSSEVILIVPVCPVNPRVAPLVVPQHSEILVEIIGPRPAVVCIDGENECGLSIGEKLTLHHSDSPARFFAWADFYRKLEERP
jgi:NAD+ kinase